MLTFDYNWIQTRQVKIFESNTICVLEMTGDCDLIFSGNFRQKCVKIQLKKISTLSMQENIPKLLKDKSHL